jgi:hypothetical protein
VAALVIELLAVAVVLAAVVVLAVKRGTVCYVYQVSAPGAYESYKHQLGKALLLGLELLVVADVVRTVALEPTLKKCRDARPPGAHPHLPELVVNGRDGGTLAMAIAIIDEYAKPWRASGFTSLGTSGINGQEKSKAYPI